MKGCILSNEPLKANRRDIVALTSTSEKPVISAEELLENCRGGMSYASTSKKLGIDPSKEEVLSVFKILKEVGDDFPDVESEDIIVPKQYPTPLWFMWNSELDVIAQASVPDVNDILSSSVTGNPIWAYYEPGGSDPLAELIRQIRFASGSDPPPDQFY